MDRIPNLGIRVPLQFRRDQVVHRDNRVNPLCSENQNR
ncbi:hypothetical protein GCE9029_05076 [Grimontia celer]|uniref:Uncharacterized protein n=1 Tax=Grimontia celer TaxID=1796497 RepID=A0A128FFH2_9GAMM|nr:hypothetical protein GCE9029_05076 [Grimontia celer]